MAYRSDDEIKIDDALRVLEDAAREKKDEVKRIVQSRYSGIKDLFSTENLGRLGEPINRVKDALSKSGRIAKRSVSTARYELEEHPMMFIAKVAAAALIVGYFLGRRSGNGHDYDTEMDYEER
jgi:ElaB/YqjD/DUF883 family membrane-anchored ribosome-binding protein